MKRSEEEQNEPKHDLILIRVNRDIARAFAEENDPYRKMEELVSLKLRTYDRNKDTILKIQAYDAYIQFTIITKFEPYIEIRDSKEFQVHRTNVSAIVEYEQDTNEFKKKLYKTFNVMNEKIKWWK